MWHTMTKDEVKRKLHTDLDYGLNSREVIKRQKEYGKNKLQKQKGTNIFIKFLLQFNDFMIIVLLIAAVVSAVMSYVQGTRRIYRFYYNYFNCNV